MRDVLELCIKLDTASQKTYETLSELCPDEEIAHTFRQLAIEEKTHIGWWTQLLEAWDGGLVPDIGSEQEMRTRLIEISDSVSDIDLAHAAEWSCDDMLETAVKYEFYMIDPVFSELIDLVEPGGVHTVEAYDRHVYRLVELVERRYTRPGLGSLLAGVLRRAYQDRQRLASLATHDQLTGLLNRRGVITQLEQWLSWSKRYNRSLGVVLLDLDHMKEINDRLGHQAGDEALVETARTITREVRDADVVGRVGGDEFLIIAPEAGHDELEALMARLATALRDRHFESGGQKAAIAASVGGAWQDGQGAATTEMLVALADRSLYGAKAAGRARAGDVLHPEADEQAAVV